MLLSLTTTVAPATDFGFLLHKNPGSIRSVRLWFGQAQVFFPEATKERCTATLLLEVVERSGRDLDRHAAIFTNDRIGVVTPSLRVGDERT